jgi:magnesium-transporting ATPase (P-type)
VILFTLFKDAWDDLKRRWSDRGLNERKYTERLKVTSGHGHFERIAWSKVRVGDVLRVSEDNRPPKEKDGTDSVPADLAVLWSSDPKGELKIETMDLDGETNLKTKKAFNPVHELCKARAADSDTGPEDVLSQLEGVIEFGFPNVDLGKFEGSVQLSTPTAAAASASSKLALPQYSGELHALDASNLLLRGVNLKTKSVIGVAVYVGPDTKIMKNGGVARFKKTQVEIMLNKLVGFIIIILLCSASIGAIMNAVWLGGNGEAFSVAYNWYHNLPTRAECSHESAGKNKCDASSEDGLRYERGSIQEAWFSQRYRDENTIAGLQFMSSVPCLLFSFVPARPLAHS